MLEIFLTRSFSIIQDGLGIIFDFYFLWLPLFLFLIFWSSWKRYVVADALLNEETMVFQIKLPREISKSPKAMELFLQTLFQTGGEGHFYKKYWKGGTRPWFSLELVSIEGEVRFYIWTRKKFSKMVETQLYAQYPSVEVVEAEDYTKKIKYDPKEIELFGSMFTLDEDDPYPIKTYIDYGLEADPKEEFKIDPIASTIEFLGSIGKGEQVWMQTLIRAHKKYKKKVFLEELLKTIKKPFGGKSRKNWEEEGKEIVDVILTTPRMEEYKEDDPKIKMYVQSKGEQQTIESVERAISKPGFDTAIRVIYLAEEEYFDVSTISGMMSSFKQYTSGLNRFKPVSKETTDFDAPWMDPLGSRLAERKRKLFNHYIRRAHFETRHNIRDFILNTEELATIFHFPPSVVETPTLPRMEAKKVEPPPNLPL